MGEKQWLCVSKILNCNAQVCVYGSKYLLATWNKNSNCKFTGYAYNFQINILKITLVDKCRKTGKKKKSRKNVSSHVREFCPHSLKINKKTFVRQRIGEENIRDEENWTRNILSYTSCNFTAVSRIKNLYFPGHWHFSDNKPKIE